MKPADKCAVHADASTAAVCALCGRAMCDACFRFFADSKPACHACAYEAGTRPRRRISLAVSFTGLAWGVLFWLSRRPNIADSDWTIVIIAAIAAPVVGAIIAFTARGTGAAIEPREVDEEPPPAGPGEKAHPYRARLRRVAQRIAPRISGAATALVVGASLALSAVLLPMGLKLSRWLELEVVLVLWWAMLASALSFLLYRGYHLADDWRYFAPWEGPNKQDKDARKASATKKSTGSSWAPDLGGCANIDGEGCLVILVIGIGFIAILGAAWVLVELAVPIVFLLVYTLVMRAIGRVSNDRHGCEGNALRAVGWGALWAAIYVAPLAIVVGAVYYAAAVMAAG